MDINQIATFLNKWQGGEILLFLVGCYTVIRVVIAQTHKFIAWYRSRVTEDLDKKKQMTGIINDITNLKKEMSELTENFDSYRETVENRLKESESTTNGAKMTTAEKFDDLEKSIREISPKIQLLEQKIEKLESRIGELLRSDVDYIKAYITDAYNKYVTEEQHIDLLTLQNVESVYNRLLEETGTEDEFLSKLMRELRNLPTTKEE